MFKLKRWIYGQPLLSGYRATRSRALAAQQQPHPLGFRFAGTANFFRVDWEPEQRRIVDRELEQAEIFIDVGANQGIYSCIAAAKGRTVVAVEPEPGNLEFLLANIAANDFAVEVFPIAASDGPSRAIIFGDSETASLVSSWFGTSRSFAQTIATNSLDNLFAERWPGKTKLIKIDVEGFEGPALRGAARLIDSSPAPVWLIETSPRMLGEGDRPNPGFEEIFERMLGAGYRATRIDSGAVVDAAAVSEMVAQNSAGLGYFLFEKANGVTSTAPKRIKRQ